MSILLMPAIQLFVMNEGSGGLFDFNATLPLMAIQFILLSVVLTFVFYKPLLKVIDDRDAYINNNCTTASEKLRKADDLYQEYEEQLKNARISAQRVIAQSEKEAKNIVANEMNDARQSASRQVETTNKELTTQKTRLFLYKNQFEPQLFNQSLNRLQSLDNFVDDISQIIKEKLLGQEMVL
jgi:F-type H+-transporting ATPase subunit b